jgi:multidrug resistance efflux pump
MSGKPSYTEKQAAIAAAKVEVAQAEAALAAAKHKLAQAEDMGLGSWSKAMRDADRSVGLR